VEITLDDIKHLTGVKWGPIHSLKKVNFNHTNVAVAIELVSFVLYIWCPHILQIVGAVRLVKPLRSKNIAHI